MSKSITNLENFENDILEGVSLVQFYADWCGPCKMITPHVEEVANRYEGRAKVIRVNVDVERELAMRFEIRSIPTLIVFKDGEAVEQLVGYKTADVLSSELDKFL